MSLDDTNMKSAICTYAISEFCVLIFFLQRALCSTNHKFKSNNLGQRSRKIVSYQIVKHIKISLDFSDHMQKKVPDFQRVLILQGGGSLGAYEAGAYKALYEMVTKMDNERGFKGKPLIDIVAGTSIGAINSAVLVNYVIENNTWEGSSERLKEFWEYLSKETSLDYIPGFTYWWDFFHNKVNHDIATGEAPQAILCNKRVFGCRNYCFLSFNASTRYKVF